MIGWERDSTSFAHATSRTNEVEEIEAKIRKRYRNLPCPENKS